MTAQVLASAYGIITHHVGAINVKSAPGKGSTFTVMLPACPLEKPQPLPARETQIELGNDSILIVDDEEMVRDVTSQMLSLLGYTVKSTESGKDGLNLFKENPQSIDLVVLDILMPGMNGLETYSRLKKIREDIKVIFASGSIVFPLNAVYRTYFYGLINFIGRVVIKFDYFYISQVAIISKYVSCHLQATSA